MCIESDGFRLNDSLIHWGIHPFIQQLVWFLFPFIASKSDQSIHPFIHSSIHPFMFIATNTHSISFSFPSTIVLAFPTHVLLCKVRRVALRITSTPPQPTAPHFQSPSNRSIIESTAAFSPSPAAFALDGFWFNSPLSFCSFSDRSNVRKLKLNAFSRPFLLV